MRKSVKAGIIGCGYMGNFHIRKCNDRDDFDVVAVYDIDPAKAEAFAADHLENNLRVHETLESFLADGEVEHVFVCTPNNVHKELAIACLKAGKSVMCEKPVTMDLAELDEIIEVANRAGRVFSVHQNRRWDTDFLAVREVVQSGEIGRVTNILSCVQGQRGVCFGWRADPEAGGGMLYDWGIHLIDQMLQLFEGSKVESIYARLLSVLTPAVDDWFELKLVFDNGACATILVTTFALQDNPRWFVYGDRGTLRIDEIGTTKGGAARIRETVAGFDSVFSKAPMGPTRTMAPLQPEFIEEIGLPEVESDPYEYHRNLAAAVRGTEEQRVSHEDMRRAMAIVDAAFESSRLNEVLKVEI